MGALFAGFGQQVCGAMGGAPLAWRPHQEPGVTGVTGCCEKGAAAKNNRKKVIALAKRCCLRPIFVSRRVPTEGGSGSADFLCMFSEHSTDRPVASHLGVSRIIGAGTRHDQCIGQSHTQDCYPVAMLIGDGYNLDGSWIADWRRAKVHESAGKAL